jgi:hypothetical protein
MSLDHSTPPLERTAVLGPQSAAYDRVDQETSLDLEVLGRPRDIPDVERSAADPCSGLEPANQLVLPSRLGGSTGSVGGRVEHRRRDLIRDEELGARPDALVREDDHESHHKSRV